MVGSSCFLVIHDLFDHSIKVSDYCWTVVATFLCKTTCSAASLSKFSPLFQWCQSEKTKTHNCIGCYSHDYISLLLGKMGKHSKLQIHILVQAHKIELMLLFAQRKLLLICCPLDVRQFLNWYFLIQTIIEAPVETKI